MIYGCNPEFLLQGASYLHGKIFQEKDRLCKKSFFIVTINKDNKYFTFAPVFHRILDYIGGEFPFGPFF